MGQAAEIRKNTRTCSIIKQIMNLEACSYLKHLTLDGNRRLLPSTRTRTPRTRIPSYHPPRTSQRLASKIKVLLHHRPTVEKLTMRKSSTLRKSRTLSRSTSMRLKRLLLRFKTVWFRGQRPTCKRAVKAKTVIALSLQARLQSVQAPLADSETPRRIQPPTRLRKTRIVVMTETLTTGLRLQSHQAVSHIKPPVQLRQSKRHELTVRSSLVTQ